MRTVTLLCSLLLLSAMAFSQNVIRGYSGYCPYGCGPYVPLITTPELSFATASQNPVGATNATGGLIAGATNSTLSEVSGDIDATYTVPVWYSGGGTPLISPAVNAPFGEPRMERMEFGRRMRPTPEAGPRASWIFFSSAERASAGQLASAAKGMRHAARTYSNQDVARQNQNNGLVKYDSRTLKIQ